MTSDLTKAARHLRAARQRLEAAMRAAEHAAKEAHAAGTPETVIARNLDVNRMTVRRWLGKRPPLAPYQHQPFPYGEEPE